MTIDRAIEILDPEHREVYGDIEEVNQACRMGMEALKRQRWIPVTERMPPDYVCVLIWDSIDKDAFTGHYSKYDGWEIDGFYEENEIFEITNWMFLPKPPEVDTNGGKYTK